MEIDPRVFDPTLALKPFDEKFDWKAMNESPTLDDPTEIKKAREDDGRTKVNH